MSSSFPKPAQRRSSQAGGRNAGDQNVGGQHAGNRNANDRSRRSGPAARPRKPKPAARPARSKGDSDWTSGQNIGMTTSGPDAADLFAPRAEKQDDADPGARFDRRGGKRDEGQEAPVLPGLKPVLELLQSTPERVDAVFLRKGRHGKDMERIVDLCRAAGVRFSLLDPASFARVYEGHSQGVVARLFEAGFADLDDMLAGVMDSPLPLILVLDQVQDPGNAGTLARTLYALGGAGLVAPRHNGVYLGAAAAKAAAGALDKLPVSKVANLGQAVDSAKKSGFTIYGAASGYGTASPDGREAHADGSQRADHGESLSGGNAGKKAQAGERLVSGKPVVDVFSLTPRLPAMLILGSEEDGMRAGMEKRCDCLIRIPMLRDFDSLNVAQAGGIIISWFAHSAARTGKMPVLG